MRKYYYRKILIALFVINIVGICAVYFKYCRNVLPNAIELTMGEKACLKIRRSGRGNGQGSEDQTEPAVRADQRFGGAG